MNDEPQDSRFRERKIISNVFNYFKNENSLLKRNALVEMTVQAAGASATSVKIIVVEEDVTSHLAKIDPKDRKPSTDWMSLTSV